MIQKIVVANRGEIAARIIRTVHDLGLQAVAVYAEADANSPAVELADEAYCLGGGSLAETYLNVDKILEIAERSGADALHPGYGFLSEVASFADAVTGAGLTWIGPSAETINQLGDKISARRTAISAGVQPVPGTNESTDMDAVRAFVEEHGLPIVAKRSDGGGGRGIEILRSDQDLNEFEARHAGADIDAYFLEKFVENGRHVETQCMADAKGNFAVATTRDCSVQRRNQKLIEEAPAPELSEKVQATLAEWSEALFRTTNYQGLGTCEFLVKGEDVYFLEVNPRLQVEHTVSEEITGLDLVMQQIRIANGEELVAIPEPRGHSIELRITSENAELMPTAGVITHLDWPTGHGVRIETGVREGDTVSPEFDSMIAKLIITGTDRDNCIARCHRALRELTIVGVSTPIDLLEEILAHPDFRNMNIGTKWMEEEFLPNSSRATEFANGAGGNGAHSAASANAAGAGGGEGWTQRRDVVVEIDGKRHTMTLPTEIFAAGQRPEQPRRSARATNQPTVQPDGAVDAQGILASPMQSIVVRIPVEVGQQVKEGDILLVLEAMKMEKYIHSTVDGTVEEVLVDVAANVPAGTPLLKLAVA